MNDNSLLITGASGFVGLNLLHRALLSGETVVGLSAAPIPAPLAATLRALPGHYTEVVGDVRDRPLLAALMKAHKVDRVCHLAAITASAARERLAADEIISVNLGGLAAVLTAAGQAGVRRFVNTSSIAVYGGQPADGSLIEEETPHRPQTLYAITKSDGESITARLGELQGLDWIVARLGRVFGPFEHDTGVRDTLSQIHQVTACARAGQAVTFDRPCLKNWSYAPDVALRLHQLLNTNTHRHRVYNLGAEHAWTLADWCELLVQRFPDFRYAVGTGRAGASTGAGNNSSTAVAIDLVGPRDSGLLSWQRYAHEFKPLPSADLPSAFAGTLQSLAD
jgi:nucleoside-diphosphate-sugar epimerase